MRDVGRGRGGNRTAVGLEKLGGNRLSRGDSRGRHDGIFIPRRSGRQTLLSLGWCGLRMAKIPPARSGGFFVALVPPGTWGVGKMAIKAGEALGCRSSDRSIEVPRRMTGRMSESEPGGVCDLVGMQLIGGPLKNRADCYARQAWNEHIPPSRVVQELERKPHM